MSCPPTDQETPIGTTVLTTMRHSQHARVLVPNLTDQATARASTSWSAKTPRQMPEAGMNDCISAISAWTACWRSCAQKPLSSRPA